MAPIRKVGVEIDPNKQEIIRKIFVVLPKTKNRFWGFS